MAQWLSLTLARQHPCCPVLPRPPSLATSSSRGRPLYEPATTLRSRILGLNYLYPLSSALRRATRCRILYKINHLRSCSILVLTSHAMHAIIISHQELTDSMLCRRGSHIQRSMSLRMRWIAATVWCTALFTWTIQHPRPNEHRLLLDHVHQFLQ